ncbi:MAG: hypothetical protein KDI79_31990 [Anaerolineae bacterium]|nr:hypothetical protein [Anaerolineae bacterium]
MMSFSRREIWRRPFPAFSAVAKSGDDRFRHFQLSRNLATTISGVFSRREIWRRLFMMSFNRREASRRSFLAFSAVAAFGDDHFQHFQRLPSP